MATTPAAKGAISRKPLSPFNFKVRQSPIVHPSLPDNCTIFVTPDCPLPNVHTHTHTPPLAAVSRATQCTCSCTHLLSQQCLAPPNAHARKHTSSCSCVSRHPMHMLVVPPPSAQKPDIPIRAHVVCHSIHPRRLSNTALWPQSDKPKRCASAPQWRLLTHITPLDMLHPARTVLARARCAFSTHSGRPRLPSLRPPAAARKLPCGFSCHTTHCRTRARRDRRRAITAAAEGRRRPHRRT